jgi:hypothetical protein
MVAPLDVNVQELLYIREARTYCGPDTKCPWFSDGVNVPLLGCELSSIRKWASGSAWSASFERGLTEQIIFQEGEIAHTHMRHVIKWFFVVRNSAAKHCASRVQCQNHQCPNM